MPIWGSELRKACILANLDFLHAYRAVHESFPVLWQLGKAESIIGDVAPNYGGVVLAICKNAGILHGPRQNDWAKTPRILAHSVWPSVKNTGDLQSYAAFWAGDRVHEFWPELLPR